MPATNDSMEVEYYSPNNVPKDGDTSEWQPLTVSSSNRDNYGSSNSSNGEKKAGRPMITTDLECRTRLRRWDNIGLPICYLTVGICQGLSRPLLNVYPLDLYATEAQQGTLAFIVFLPATIKILFGFLSDNFPIFGYRRKPYMLLGWGIVSIAMVLFLYSADLTMSYDTATTSSSTKHVSVPPRNAPSIEWLSICFLLFGMGLWLADVMADSIVAEKARCEPSNNRGHLQSTCYACRFLGLMLAAPLSTFCYSYYGPGSVVILIALTPLPMIPLIYLLQEDVNLEIPSTRHQLREIWNTVSSRSVWQPMAFIYLYNLLQVQNLAWKQYLQTVLNFGAVELNALLVVSYLCLFVGTLAYKFLFLKSSWRRVYQVCILVNGVLTALQLLLITGHTFGMSEFWFALGDDAAAEFISGVQFLPSAILLVTLCPPGSEGASYAMFTTSWNSAILLAPSISSMLLPIWNVSVQTLESGDLSGLFRLSILTAIVQTSPVLLLWLLPHSPEELLQLGQRPISKMGSTVGGCLFLGITAASVTYVIVVGVLNIVDPGWAGES